MDHARRLLAPVILCVAPLVAAVACYGPTQVTVALSTDLACDVPLRTAIYKGSAASFQGEKETETSTCDRRGGAVDADIGSLVFVPSGDRDGRASVKVVLARGKSPDACVKGDLDCIVATRSFQFVAHSARQIPIRLLQDCLGTVCDDGTTCVAKGKCTRDDACPNDDCESPASGGGDAGPPPIETDAATDAPPDVTVPSLCGGPKGAQLHMAAEAPTLAAASPNAIFWVAPSTNIPGGIAVWKVAKAGGAPIEVMAIGGFVQVTITALIVSGEDPIVVHGDSNFSVRIAGVDYAIPDAKPPTILAGDKLLLVASNAISMWRVDTTKGDVVQVATFGATSATTDLQGTVFAGGPSGVVMLGPTDSTFGAPVTASPFGANFLSTGTTGIVVGSGRPPVAQDDAIFRVNAVSATFVSTFYRFKFINSVAADADFAYVAASTPSATEVYRHGLGPAPGGELVFAGGPDIHHLSVDGSCLYYWDKNILNIRSKVP